MNPFIKIPMMWATKHQQACKHNVMELQSDLNNKQCNEPPTMTCVGTWKQ
jgi:hypothetical protein